MPTNPCLALGYTRVSSDQQAYEGMSIELQQDAIDAYSKAHGYTLEATFTDVGVSGATRQGRTALERLLERVRSGDVCVVVVRHLDRLSRNLKDLKELLEELHAAGVRLETIDDQIGGKTGLNSEADEMFVDLVAVFAEWQLHRISKPTKQTQAELRAQGRVDSRDRFGFEKDPPVDQPRYVDEGGREYRVWVENATEIEVLKELWRLYQEHGTYAEVSRRLNAASQPTKREGGHWHPGTVKAQVRHLQTPSLKNLYSSVLNSDEGE